MSTLSRENGWILRRDDAVRCTCQPVNPRHADGWQCVTPEQIKAWRESFMSVQGQMAAMELQHPERLVWLWLQFSQDPEAKRLSGRTEAQYEAARDGYERYM